MTIEAPRIEDDGEVKLYAKRGITLVRGEGVFLWDDSGKRYLDAMSNYGVNVLGHRHPAVNNAVRQQLDRLTNCHQSFYNDVRAQFEETIRSALPASLSRLAYANSGTEANEAAIKFARLASGRRRIISTVHGYHGRTLGALSVTGVQKYREGLDPLLGDCDQVPYGDGAELEKIIAGAAAVILEPIQGESGVHLPDLNYLRSVRDMCDQNGVLLILDEIQTGMGRTGRMFAFEHVGIVPDIVSVSKGIANGLPMGVTVVTEEVASRIPAGSHGGTFSGNPLVCAAATATIATIMGDGFLERVTQVGERMLSGLRSIESRMVREARGQGLMIAVELKTRMTPVLKALQEGDVLALPAGPRTIRFLPPLILDPEQADEIVEAVRSALTVLDEC